MDLKIAADANDSENCSSINGIVKNRKHSSVCGGMTATRCRKRNPGSYRRAPASRGSGVIARREDSRRKPRLEMGAFRSYPTVIRSRTVRSNSPAV
jgi:hypothetical protein